MKFFDFLRAKTKKTEVQVDVNRITDNVEEANNSKEKITYNSSTTLIEVLNFIRDNSSYVGIELNKPATDIEIENFRNSKTELPEDFKLLYKFCNGFETDEDLFRLIPLDEIIENEDDSYLISDKSFHFTEYMIYSNMWSVDINVDNINSYRIYNKEEEVVFLTTSLTEFLCVFINKGLYDGLYRWGEVKKKING